MSSEPTPKQPSKSGPGSSSSPGEPDGEGLAAAVEVLETDPGHLTAWLRVATRLYDEPDAGPAERALARQALDSIAASLGEAGHLPLAIVACLRLSERGAERAAWARLLGLGNAYGKTSTRTDPDVQPRQPQPPRPISGSGTPPTDAAAPAPGPGPELRARAAAALRKAAAHVISVQMAAAQSERPREPLPLVPLFSALLPDAFVKLAQQLTVTEFPAGAYILRAGEVGDALYVIARGTVRIERDDGIVLATLRAGSFFGEMALLTRTRRLAHAIAVTPVVLLRASREALEQLTARDDSIALVLAQHARRRFLQTVMLTSHLFRGLSPEAQHKLMERFVFRRYPAGEVLIRDGHAGTELLVIVSGRAEVARRQAPGSPVLVPIASLGVGDVLGEISLLTRRSTMALVHALEPVAVLVLSQGDFEAVAAEHPQVLQMLRALAQQRIEQTRDSKEDQPAARLPALPALHTPELFQSDEVEPLL